MFFLIINIKHRADGVGIDHFVGGKLSRGDIVGWSMVLKEYKIFLSFAIIFLKCKHEKGGKQI